MKIMNLDPTLHHTQILKCVIKLNIIAKNVKYLEENIEENIHDIGLCNSFLDMTSKDKQQKKK